MKPSFQSFIERARSARTRPSLKFILLALLGSSMLIAILLISVGVAIFVWQAEGQSWKSQKSQAVASAARTIEMFMSNNFETMDMVGHMQRSVLKLYPQTLQEMLRRSPALLEIVRIDEEGKVLALSYQDHPVIASLFTIPQSSWFRQAQEGKTYVGEIQLSAENEPYIILAIPAEDNGVVAARLEMKVLQQVVGNLRFGETGQTYIVDRQGEVIAHPNTAVILHQTSLVDLPSFNEMLAAPQNQWYGRYQNTFGDDVMGASAQVPNRDWIIITEVSFMEAFATSRQALVSLAATGLITGIVVMLISVRILRVTIFAPVAQLRNGVERIGKGELDYRIPIINNDELGEVASAFNHMAVRLLARNEALEKARNEALQASAFKSRLLANVGHDLRTPINSILGYADIMNEGVYGDLNEQQKRANSRILSSSRRLLNLINSILDQSQIEAGKIILHHEPYNPRDILRSVREAMEIPAQTKGLLLQTECEDEVPQAITGDLPRSLQIAMNLVENGLKFTQQGGVTLRLARPNAGQWSIQVSDTGPGIPFEAQETIFEAFRQLDGSTTRENRGIGLGLSIVKQLTNVMGGRVELSSQSGQGSTFTIYLPLDLSDDPDALTVSSLSSQEMNQ